jgi:predicted Fe-S protein YdhL (DUF1289 family)
MVGGQTVELEPGQFIFGRKRWAEELGMTEKQIRLCVRVASDLRSDQGQIRAIRRASKFTIYEVINWHLYQDSTSNEVQHEGRQKGQHEGQQRASKGPHLKNVENEKKKTFLSDSDEFRLAELLFELIRQRNPEHKAPDLQAWARHIDLMIRVDGRAPERIEQVMRWAAKDSFWSKNILSTAKLREKFDALAMKMGGTSKPLRDISHLAAV